MAATYTIADEPRPNAYAKFAVRPFWPLLAVMFGGTWLSWSWFLLNGCCIGSPTLREEVKTVIKGLIGALVIVVAGMLLLGAVGLSPEQAKPKMRYVLSVALLWKLWITYQLYNLQQRTFDIYEYYGGTVKNGLPVVIVSIFIGPLVLGALHGLSVLLFFVLV